MNSTLLRDDIPHCYYTLKKFFMGKKHKEFIVLTELAIDINLLILIYHCKNITYSFNACVHINLFFFPLGFISYAHLAIQI